MSVQQNKVDQAVNTAGDLIAEGQTIRQMQTTYATAVAVQKPRSLNQVASRCEQEAALAGESIYYGWGAGQNRIEGPSVKCAMIAMRNWGNAAVEMLPIHETHQAYIMTAAFIDLETGTTITRQFRQSKNWMVYGKHDEYRKEDIRFQIGQSKAQRNVILHALPEWLIDKMLEKAKEGVREKIQAYVQSNGIEAARQLALKALKKHGIDQGRVEQKLEKKIGAWDVETLVLLKGDIKALDDGAESAEALFPLPEIDQSAEHNPDLDPEKMTAGDPGDHQDLEPKRTSKQKKDENLGLLQKVGELRASSKIDSETFTAYLQDNFGVAKYGALDDRQLKQLKDWLETQQ